jgi:CheY-like chemotaxis protein
MPSQNAARAGQLTESSGEIRKLRVLVVEDSVDQAEGLAELIRSWGHSVQRAHNGAEALHIAREYRPAVVLLDLGLPDMHGYELAKRLRAEAHRRRLHFVVITGWTQIADQLSSSAAGIAHHLIKPPNVSVVREILAGYQEAMATEEEPA